MKRMMIFGLCLTSAFAMSAATASASATTPEFRFASGSKEFSSISSAGKIENSNGETLECEKETSTSEIEGTSPSDKVRHIVVSNKGCTVTVLTKTYKCKSPGANEEEIVSFDLLARLGWIDKAKGEVGALVGPEEGRANNPKDLDAELACTKGEESIAIKIRGSGIGRVTPVNKLIAFGGSFLGTTTKGSSKGEPGIKKFEGLPEDHLETETTISKKFLETSTEGSGEAFPLVSTEIEA
jgi:hypothetical protein